MKDIEVRHRNIIAVAPLTVGIAAMMLSSTSLVSAVFAQSNSGHSFFGSASDRFQEGSKQAQKEFNPFTDGHDTTSAWSNEYEALHGHLIAR